MIKNDPKGLCLQAIEILRTVDELLESAYEKHLEEESKVYSQAA